MIIIWASIGQALVRVRGLVRARAQHLLQEVGEHLHLLLSYPASTSECRS